jgi:hypothetical protein
VQRLPNGNTLVCEGIPGHFFELTPQGEIVWDYVNPVVDQAILAQGESPEIDPRGHPMNAIFKIHRYAPDYAGLAGRDLTPGDPIERNPWTSVVRKNSAQSSKPPSFTLLPGGAGVVGFSRSVAAGTLKIVDTRGRQVLGRSFSGSEARFEIGRIPAGIYHMRIQYDGLIDRRAILIR